MRITITELEKTHKLSHCSLARGYVSRKTDPKTTEYYVNEYNGRFGKGYKMFQPNYESSRYCYVCYWIEK